jgi:hypothetical protein
MTNQQGFDIYIKFSDLNEDGSFSIEGYVDDLTRDSIRYILSTNKECVLKFNLFDPGVYLLTKEKLPEPGEPEE